MTAELRIPSRKRGKSAEVDGDRLLEREPEAGAGLELVTLVLLRAELLGGAGVVLVADGTGNPAARRGWPCACPELFGADGDDAVDGVTGNSRSQVP